MPQTSNGHIEQERNHEIPAGAALLLSVSKVLEATHPIHSYVNQVSVLQIVSSSHGLASVQVVGLSPCRSDFGGNSLGSLGSAGGFSCFSPD